MHVLKLHSGMIIQLVTACRHVNCPSSAFCKTGGPHVSSQRQTTHLCTRLTTDSLQAVLQTDGWFSEKSASIYEASTETLFLGRQDAMQRQSLVPLHRFMQARSGGRQVKGDNTKMLEVACGTGRFATFVKVPVPFCELDAVPVFACFPPFCPCFGLLTADMLTADTLAADMLTADMLTADMLHACGSVPTVRLGEQSKIATCVSVHL